MIFNSIEYLFFLPIAFLIYWAIGYARINESLKLRLQNAFVVIASYFFYGWWDWRFLGLLFGMSLFSWISGQMIAERQNHAEGLGGGAKRTIRKGKWRAESGEQRVEPGKIWLWICITINLLILGLFKYYNFFVNSFADLFGLQNSIHSLKIVLPLGISFFTFQAVSYVVDVCKRKIESTNLIDCLFYIGFFPKLLAGPIERPTNLIPQIQKPRLFEYDLAVDGCRQMLWGLFKKVVIADNCALYVNQVYGDYANQSGSTLLLAAILYTIQIYGDFSGYSDMAIGSAKLLGFRFRDNFLFPYFSRNMNKFWRRWHISLNTWFVDYVYIPLGGSRPKIDNRWIDNRWTKSWTKLITCRNIMIVFLLSGLWHGADWSFVAWGAYHGLLLVLLILLNRNTKYEHVVAYDRWYPNVKEIGQMMMVFMLATIGWILFRADTMGQAWEYLCGICDKSLFSIPYLMTRAYYIPTFLLVAVMFVVEWLTRRERNPLAISKVIPNKYLRWVIYWVIIALIYEYGNFAYNQFIYFQF